MPIFLERCCSANFVPGVICSSRLRVRGAKGVVGDEADVAAGGALWYSSMAARVSLCCVSATFWGDWQSDGGSSTSAALVGEVETRTSKVVEDEWPFILEGSTMTSFAAASVGEECNTSESGAGNDMLLSS